MALINFTKVINGPGELDFALHVIGRQESLTFKLGGEKPEDETCRFSTCRVTHVRMFAETERMINANDGCTPIFMLTLQVYDESYPDVERIVISYSLLGHKGRVYEMHTHDGKGGVEIIRPFTFGDRHSDAEIFQGLHPIFYELIDFIKGFSPRTYNCLKNANVNTVFDLAAKTEADLQRTKNFGMKSLNEIREVLASRNLHSGMSREKMLMWVPPSPQLATFKE